MKHRKGWWSPPCVLDASCMGCVYLKWKFSSLCWRGRLVRIRPRWEEIRGVGLGWLKFLKGLLSFAILPPLWAFYKGQVGLISLLISFFLTTTSTNQIFPGRDWRFQIRQLKPHPMTPHFLSFSLQKKKCFFSNFLLIIINNNQKSMRNCTKPQKELARGVCRDTSYESVKRCEHDFFHSWKKRPHCHDSWVAFPFNGMGYIYLFIMLFLHSKGLSFALVAYAFNYYNRIDYVIILLIKISTL